MCSTNLYLEHGVLKVQEHLDIIYMDWGINIIPLQNVLYYNYVMVFLEGGNASPFFERG